MELIKKRKTAEYKIYLAIVQNPHAEKPQELWDIFNSADKELDLEEKVDVAGFEAFKSALSQNPKIQIKS